MASNEIFYEKYRPKQLSHVIGQDVPVKILTQSCVKDVFHHSYLMAGRHGTGKTSTARILAAIFTCQNRARGSAVVCGKCPACLSAYAGSGSVDIYELDGASNSKIENTRSIIESSRYAPQQFAFKVFIIDECHRLSAAAMTSLLKTLEEPPESSVFILCTTEISKVPKEIISRCQTLHFKPVASSAISAHISRLFICKKVEIEQEAVDCIARASRGSVRDAMGLSQDVMIMYDGNKIQEKDVSKLIGTVGKDEIYGLIKHISNKDMFSAFELLEQMVSSNVNIRVVFEELCVAFRNIMVSKVDMKFVSDLTKSEQQCLMAVKDKFEIREVAGFLSYFEQAQKAFDVNINNRLVLGAVVVNLIERP